MKIAQWKKGVQVAIATVLVVIITLLGARRTWYLVQELTFPWMEHTQAELDVKAFAQQHGLFYAEYPKSLIDLFNRNPETSDFVLMYPLREKEPMDLSGYHREDGVPLFLQWDKQWGYEKYGRDFLAVTGCGPTCLAMVGYYLTGEESMNPKDVAAFAQDNGYYARGYGSSWTLISQGSAQLGLEAQELPLVKKKITTALEAGHPVILALGAGDFTTTGHYIVLTGLENGFFRVNDPNSRDRSAKLWSYDQLEPQIRNIWAISLPA